MVEVPEEDPKTSRLGLAVKVVIGVVVIALLLVVGRQLGSYIPAFLDWVDSLGVWAPIVFILGYAVATVFFIPGSPLTLAAGAVFGLAKGTLYAFTGASIGAALAFLVARYAARKRIENKLADIPKFKAIDQAVGRDGGKIVALMRLSPVFPFNLLNYALGLTSVKFWHYVAANFAMLPATLLYVYYGKVAGEVARATTGGSSKSLTDWIAIVVGLLATILVTVVIAKKAKKALDESALAEDESTTA